MGPMVNSAFLQSFHRKRIFVTGHTGFKGSWLSYILSLCGAEVLGYSLPAEDRSHFELLKLDNKVSNIFADIRDFDNLSIAIKDFSPEYIFHLAAQPLVRYSYINPKETFDINVNGGINLLEVARSCSTLRSLVFITSDKCYENNEWIWGYRESDLMGGIDPYSSSKGAIELIFSSYLRSFFIKNPILGSATVRAGNVIGGGDWSKDRLIPDIVRSLISNESILIRSPESTRPWQHVLEPISGYLKLGSFLYSSPKKYTGSWNFGPLVGYNHTVLDVANQAVDCFGSGSVQFATSGYCPHEANLLQLNSDKARQLLDWHTLWDFETTVNYTIEWYKDVLIHNKRAEFVTRPQINQYFGTDL